MSKARACFEGRCNRTQKVCSNDQTALENIYIFYTKLNLYRFMNVHSNNYFIYIVWYVVKLQHLTTRQSYFSTLRQTTKHLLKELRRANETQKYSISKAGHGTIVHKVDKEQQFTTVKMKLNEILSTILLNFKYISAIRCQLYPGYTKILFVWLFLFFFCCLFIFYR